MRRFFSNPALLVLLVVAALVWWTSRHNVQREQEDQLARMIAWHQHHCQSNFCAYANRFLYRDR
jgi:hypothetical protein